MKGAHADGPVGSAKLTRCGFSEEDSPSTEFKRQVVAEYHDGETLHALCRGHDLSRNLIRIWIEKTDTGGVDKDVAATELMTLYET